MENTSPFHAAAAQVDITPGIGAIIGVDMLPTYVETINDPLFAKVLLIKNGQLTMAIFVIDICIMHTDYMDDIKQKIFSNTGILPQNILLSSNHNHASGDVVGLLGGKVDQEYKDSLPDKIVKATQEALANLKPARIGYGSVQAPEFVVSRRYLMDDAYEAKNPVSHGKDKVKTNPFNGEKHIIRRVSEPDPELCFIAIKDMAGKWISVLANYGLHYAADWPAGVITADYFGAFSKHIKENLNAEDNFVAMMSNGTSGDINIWDFLEPDRFPKAHFEKSELIGKTLAQRVSEVIPNIEWQDTGDLAVLNEKIQVEIRKPNIAEIELAKQNLEQVDFDKIANLPNALQHVYDREQVLLADYPAETSLQLQVIKIGKIIVGALPGEFFAETGLALKKENKAKPYFSINLSNSYGGYIPPVHEFEMGGYETWRARSSCMEISAEGKIRKMVDTLIKNI